MEIRSLTSWGAIVACVLFTLGLLLLEDRVDKLENRGAELDEQAADLDRMFQRIIDIEWQLEETRGVGAELQRLEQDIDVCHGRVDDAFWALDVVSRVEGARARAPTVTKRERPKKP